MTLNRCAAFVLALALAGFSAISAAQTRPGGPVNWGHSFALQTHGGIENPILWVGFNPQPEPPAFGTSLSFPSLFSPRLSMPSPGGLPGDSFFDVFFAIGGTRTQFSLPPPDADIDSFNSVQFDVFAPSGGTAFQVFFDVSTSGGGQGTNLVQLNPQPEVPSSALFGPNAYGGFNFQFTGFSELYVDLRILDAGGNQLAVAAIPEPQTYAMLIAGLALLGIAVRRRRSSAA